jgi:hypothetical protein
MYKYATAKGVPLLPATAWGGGNKADFEISKVLIENYNDYIKKVGNYPSLGHLINKHMELYFSWRFRAIKMKAAGNRGEASRISAQRDEFAKSASRIDDEIVVLQKKEEIAAAELNAAISRRAAQTTFAYSTPTAKPASNTIDPDVRAAQERRKNARDELLKAKARKLANPNMDDLMKMLDLYDAQLLEDVKAIRVMLARRQNLTGTSARQNSMKLRPHYKILVEAYENEFEKNMGLTDPSIISFFDNYVHDSLAAFAGDATLPSDPRVVYLGGDEKYQFASYLDEELVNEKSRNAC